MSEMVCNRSWFVYIYCMYDDFFSLKIGRCFRWKWWPYRSGLSVLLSSSLFQQSQTKTRLLSSTETQPHMFSTPNISFCVAFHRMQKAQSCATGWSFASLVLPEQEKSWSYHSSWSRQELLLGKKTPADQHASNLVPCVKAIFSNCELSYDWCARYDSPEWMYRVKNTRVRRENSWSYALNTEAALSMISSWSICN